MTDVAKLWDDHDAAGSEGRFREAAETVTGDRREVLLTQVARALGLQGRFDEGHALLDGLGSASAETQVRVELERGRLLRSAGRVHESRPHFETAARLAFDHGLDALRLDALHMVALVVPEGERIDAGLRALDVARASRDPAARNWDASLLNNIGMEHGDAGEWETAISYLEEALEARERIGNEARIEEARSALDWARKQLADQDDGTQDEPED